MTQGDFADLEIRLDRRDASTYTIEFRFIQPGAEADSRFGGDQPVIVKFDWDSLRASELDPRKYGQTLTDSLLAQPVARDAFFQVLAAAEALAVPLRLRINIGPSAPELHNLRWETLIDPRYGSVLATSENLILSRYLSSRYLTPIGPTPKRDLKALIVVANPTNLEEYQLAAINTHAELTLAENSLGAINFKVLTREDNGARATIDNIKTHLRGSTFDILYLICHGTSVEGVSWLWLEDEEGKAARVSADELVFHFRELRYRPQLAVLASCDSAGDGEGETLRAIGPRLAEAGIPAVLAMQGKADMDLVAKVLPTFFRELERDGVVDRALSVARSQVHEHPDFWVPALFMRLRSGQIWYQPGFGNESQSLEKWPALLGSIRRKRCTAILGPGLTEGLLASRREIARQWAQLYQYPMAPYEQENLPRVAQYLSVNQDHMFPRDELMDYLQQALRERIEIRRQEDILAESTSRIDAVLSSEASLEDLIALSWSLSRSVSVDDPYTTLAKLPMPIYITTNPSSLMRQALTLVGKQPRAELCRWNRRMPQLPSVYDEEPGYRPDEENPLVYHLFGTIQEPDSLVLTEDDYFDYLIGVTRDKELIPSPVRRALANTALLFLGFRVDEWDFRILFRSLMSQEGSGLRRRYAHVAVQLDPEQGNILEPEGARRYLESYFQGADISIYWGGVEDFMRELRERW